jgi:hypothetical protein
MDAISTNLLWGTQEQIKEICGVSRRVLKDWAKKGFVRNARYNHTASVYRVDDVDQALIAVAEGRSPRKAKKV